MLSYNRLVRFSLNLFFLLMLVLPASFQAFRGVYLGIMLLFSLRFGLTKVLSYDKETIYIGSINIITSIIFIFIGLLLSAPGALNVSTVYVIWPILYFYFIGYNNKLRDILPYMSMILYGSLLSSLFISLFILGTFIGLPGIITSIAKAQDFSVGFYDGFIELNSMNLATVMYSFAFCLTILLLPKKFNYFGAGKMKFINMLCIIVSIVMILISARRAFWMVCLICPLIIILLFKISGIRIKLMKYIMPFIGVAFLGVISFSVLALDLTTINTEFDSIFEFDNPDAESNYLRKEQYEALRDGWLESPIFGKGLGAAADKSVRDEAAPWAYELSYMALIFQTGIIGIVIYSGSIIWIFYKSIKIIKVKDPLTVFLLAPQIVALSCFLIVNASNPYLAKFDYLWVVFLPIATINAISLIPKKGSLEKQILL